MYKHDSKRTVLGSVRYLFAGAAMAGAVLSMADNARAQNLFVADFGSRIYSLPGRSAKHLCLRVESSEQPRL